MDSADTCYRGQLKRLARCHQNTEGLRTTAIGKRKKDAVQVWGKLEKSAAPECDPWQVFQGCTAMRKILLS